jgi:glucitol operon activator protein
MGTDFTHVALALLAVFWSLQVAGAWTQWRHLQDSLARACRAHRDGYLGIGKARSRFGFGTVVLLLLTPDLRVRQLQTLSGLSVLARFRDQPQFQGLSLAELQAGLARPGVPPRLAAAVQGAIGQIQAVRNNPQPQVESHGSI